MGNKYLFCGIIVEDGDRIEYKEEEPNENPYNPTGKAIIVFNHKNYKCEEIKS